VDRHACDFGHSDGHHKHSRAGVISIDFVGRDTPMSPAEIAGVVARSNWNECKLDGSGFALVDETGTTTGATISWSSSPLWSLPIADTPGNFRMMKVPRHGGPEHYGYRRGSSGQRFGYDILCLC